MAGWHGGKHRLEHIYLLDILHFVHKACYSLTWNYEVAGWVDLLRVLQRLTQLNFRNCILEIDRGSEFLAIEWFQDCIYRADSLL